MDHTGSSRPSAQAERVSSETASLLRGVLSIIVRAIRNSVRIAVSIEMTYG